MAVATLGTQGCKVRSFGQPSGSEPRAGENLGKREGAERDVEKGSALSEQSNNGFAAQAATARVVRGTPMVVFPLEGEPTSGRFLGADTSGVTLARSADLLVVTSAGNAYSGALVDEDDETVVLLEPDCSLMRVNKARIEPRRTRLHGGVLGRVGLGQVGLGQVGLSRSLDAEIQSRAVKAAKGPADGRPGGASSSRVAGPFLRVLVAGDAVEVSLREGAPLRGTFLEAAAGCFLIEAREGDRIEATKDGRERLRAVNRRVPRAIAFSNVKSMAPTVLEPDPEPGTPALTAPLTAASVGSAGLRAAATARGGGDMRALIAWKGVQTFALEEAYVRDRLAFARGMPPRTKDPTQSTLYVSATSASAELVASIVLPLLVEAGVAHRVAAEPAAFDARFQGARRARFITVFLRDRASAERLAMRIEAALAPASPRFWPPLSGRPLGRSGIVSTLGR